MSSCPATLSPRVMTSLSHEERPSPGQFVPPIPAFAVRLLSADNLTRFGPKPRFLQGTILISG